MTAQPLRRDEVGLCEDGGHGADAPLPTLRSVAAFRFMSSSPAQAQLTDSLCPCRSGLRSDRCCGLDWTIPPAASRETPESDRAGAALAAGNVTEAARLLIDLLEQFPRHLDALRLLYQIRSAENEAMAAEALLARIVRLAPNNLVAP